MEQVFTVRCREDGTEKTFTAKNAAAAIRWVHAWIRGGAWDSHVSSAARRRETLEIESWLWSGAESACVSSAVLVTTKVLCWAEAA